MRKHPTSSIIHHLLICAGPGAAQLSSTTARKLLKGGHLGFFASLFGGQNLDLNRDIGTTAQIGNNAAGQGQKYLNQAGNFFSDILSGDATKQAQALSPVISAAKTSQQQNQKTASMFGGRSGGTAASTAASGDKVHSDITNLIGSLTGSSASALGSMGSDLLKTGLSGIGTNAELSQERMQNWENSILGLVNTKAVGAAEGFALGKI